jgi:hypothetical protein
MRRFTGIDPAVDPGARRSEHPSLRLPQKHGLIHGAFAEIRKQLEEKNLLVKSGTIVDRGRHDN